MQLTDKIYPRTHILMIMALNGLSFVVGLAMVAGPFAAREVPGSYDTTIHVAVGALIAVLAVFRMLLAYGAIWIDIVLAALGVITLLLPTFLHMRWKSSYLMGHLGGGGVVVGVAVISFLATMAVFKKVQR